MNKEYTFPNAQALREFINQNKKFWKGRRLTAAYLERKSTDKPLILVFDEISVEISYFSYGNLSVKISDTALLPETGPSKSKEEFPCTGEKIENIWFIVTRNPDEYLNLLIRFSADYVLDIGPKAKYKKMFVWIEKSETEIRYPDVIGKASRRNREKKE